VANSGAGGAAFMAQEKFAVRLSEEDRTQLERLGGGLSRPLWTPTRTVISNRGAAISVVEPRTNALSLGENTPVRLLLSWIVTRGLPIRQTRCVVGQCANLIEGCGRDWTVGFLRTLPYGR